MFALNFLMRPIVFVAVLLWFSAPVQSAPDTKELLARIDASLGSAAKFLISQQSPDGAWRSHKYGMMKDGPSLTPQVLAGLYAMPVPDDATRQARKRALTYISTWNDPESEVPRQFSIYTAALATPLAVIEKDDKRTRAQQSYWVQYVHERQLNSATGWSLSDDSFGGWGYSLEIPLKPKPGDRANPFAFANISATVYALQAMHCSGLPRDQSADAAALIFLARCQNFAADASKADPAFDDGGFFFTPNDAAWNKAGVAGTDRSGRTRFHSYGAATADGLRAILIAGLPPDHPRAVAARHWLESRFDAQSNPGVFEPDRKILQNATYFYYASSVSRALAPQGKEFSANGQTVSWAAELVRELLARQRADGSWTNSYTDAKEDDPLVATPAAMTALMNCRDVIAR